MNSKIVCQLGLLENAGGLFPLATTRDPETVRLCAERILDELQRAGEHTTDPDLKRIAKAERRNLLQVLRGGHQ